MPYDKLFQDDKQCWQDRLQPKQCRWCKQSFKPKRINQKHCCYKCRLRDYAKKRGVNVGVGKGGNPKAGKDHYNWKGGRAGWQRKKFRGKICQVCGATKKLELHHKNRKPDDGRPSNLITLCRTCHLQAHGWF